MSGSSMEVLTGGLQGGDEVGGKTVGVAEAAAAADAETTASSVSEDEEIDVETMTGAQMDAAVEKHNVAVPDNWKHMKVQEKKDWLQSHLSSDAPVAEVAPTETDKQLGTGKTPKKSVVKAGPTSKAGVKHVVGDVLPPDAISELTAYIENLKKEDAQDVVLKLRDSAEFTYFKLGGVLSVIQTNGWWDPYASFREYVETKHGIEYRVALHWVKIYDDVLKSGVPFAEIKHLGWTKLKDLSAVMTVDNYKEWVEKAEGNNALKVAEMVRAFKKGGLSVEGATEGESTSLTTTKAFKVHSDQLKTIDAAIEKAKGVVGTDVATVALEHMCLDYLGATSKVNVPGVLKNMGVEAALEAFNEAFPEASLSYDKAA